MATSTSYPETIEETREIRQRLGAGLRAECGRVLTEPLPEAFYKVLRLLEAADEDGDQGQANSEPLS
jgi:hypothetical protein